MVVHLPNRDSYNIPNQMGKSSPNRKNNVYTKSIGEHGKTGFHQGPLKLCDIKNRHEDTEWKNKITEFNV